MAADLRVFNLGNPSQVGPGGTLTYTLFVRNFGDTTASGIQVVDSLPPGFNVINTTPGGNFVSGGESPEDVVTFSGGTLAPGESAILTISGTAPLNATGSIQNVVVVDPPLASGGVVPEGTNENNNTATLNTTINNSLGPDLRIFKLDSPDPVAPGDPITYTLLVRNDGSATATNITVRDSLDANFTITSVTPGGNFTTTGTKDANNALTFSGGTLASGESAVLTIVGTTPITAGDTTIANIAVVDPDNAITEGSESNNTATSSTTLSTALLPDLEITKLSSPNPAVAPGGTVTYTLLVRNKGPKDISGTDIIVRDSLDANFTLTSVTPGGNFTTTGTADANNVLTFTGNSLASGESAILTIVGTVPQAEGTILNRVVVDPGDLIAEPAGDSNNTTTNNVTVSISAGPDLAIFKLGNPTKVVPGNSLTYSLLVRNDGQGATSDIKVVDTVPSELTNISATPGGDFQVQGISGNVVTFTGGSLASGESAILTIVGTVPSNVTTDLTNIAVVDPDDAKLEGGQGNLNNTATVTTSIALPDLTIFKSGNPGGTLQAGDTLTYTLTVRNDGEAATPAGTSVVVRDVLPSNFVFLNATPGGGFADSYDQATNTVTFTGGSLNTGGSAVLTIVGRARAAGAVATVTNTAVVDPDNAIVERNSNGNAEANNSASFTVNVQPPTFVYVDDDWTTLSLGQDPDGNGPILGFGIDAFENIQEGEQAVASGGTVQVFAGTYGEIVGIGKPLSLIGPNVGVNPNTPDVQARVAEATITGTSAGITFLSGASAGQVIVDGFRLEGLGTAPGAGAAIDLTNSGANTIIRNNAIVNFDNDAIRNFPVSIPVLNAQTSNLVIENNLIDGSEGTTISGFQRGMFLQDVQNLTVTGNTVRDITGGDKPGILLDTVTGEVLVSNNVVENIASQGIQVAGIGSTAMNGGGTGTVTIRNNTLSNVNLGLDPDPATGDFEAPTNGGIRLRNAIPIGQEFGTGALLSNGTVIVENNVVRDTYNGIYVRDGSVSVGSVTATNNRFFNISPANGIIVNNGSGQLNALGNFEDLAGTDLLDPADVSGSVLLT